ncbi:MAG: WD40 repeat protein [Candidatus Poriferisodalaceae bacterium]
MQQLVVLGTDGLIHLVDVGPAEGPDSLAGNSVVGNRVETSVLGRPPAGSAISAPVWGPDGSWVAWSESDGVEGTIRVVDVAGGGDLARIQGFVAFVLVPSPDGRRIAHLATGPLGLELSVSDIKGRSVKGPRASQLIARGAPLYWAWAPDGDRLVVHREGEVTVHDLRDGSEVALDVKADGFLAPWWSAGGDEIIFVDAAHRLVVVPADGAVDPIPIFQGQRGYRFAVDPTGQRVAVVIAGPDGPGEDTHVAVIDRLTGEPEIVVDEPVAGMWWSPDGRRLLTLVRAGGRDEPFVRWAVWDGGDALLSAPFQPSSQLATTILPFFEQFASAHSFWSPDSESLVTPGVMRGGRSEVFVHHIGVQRPPRPVCAGVLAWWRPEINPRVR